MTFAPAMHLKHSSIILAVRKVQLYLLFNHNACQWYMVHIMPVKGEEIFLCTINTLHASTLYCIMKLTTIHMNVNTYGLY